jgi:aspartyl/asparaginyl beta-hydroxylase (cupin superfamily)
MPADDPAVEFAALKEGADRALRSGDPRRARELFQRLTALAPKRLDLWMGLAACERSLGNLHASLAAADGALAIEPRFFPALLMKGSLLESLGLWKPAAIVYGNALKITPPVESMAEPTKRALAHAREIHARYVTELAENIKFEAGLDGLPAPLDRRADTFIEALVGRRKVYHQEPVQFSYPGLPAIEFYERGEFPWLEALEACAADIRDEALAVWGEGSAGLTPYVKYPASAPVDQWAELNHSLKWSAFHLFEGGEPVEANCARCPATMAALALVDQPHVLNRSPATMFSILRPHTHIPAHTGISNTRLVLHLALIVPEGCRFRVGGEIRGWREGEAFVFDDTIEHEAWNDSDLPRAVMICDVWSPRLSIEERELVARVHAALDNFNGAVPESGAL